MCFLICGPFIDLPLQILIYISKAGMFAHFSDERMEAESSQVDLPQITQPQMEVVRTHCSGGPLAPLKACIRGAQSG